MSDAAGLRERYLDLVVESLLANLGGPVTVHLPVPTDDGSLRSRVQRRLVARGGAVLARPHTIDPAADPEGRRNAYELPPGIQTMIGRTRLEHLRRCVVDVVERGVPGDLIETGVWRGGATVLMRAVLEAHGDEGRRVFVADSFAGLPPPDVDRFPHDDGLDFHLHPILAVGRDEVEATFDRYGLLDERVVFVEGWFKETLPRLADERFALVRLDGDLYESTMDAITALYPRLTAGGWLVVDDYNDIPACRAAITDYRAANGIDDPIEAIDFTGVCWRKGG